MQRIESVNEMQSMAIGFRTKGRLIALVPTQGALHAGHESLIAAARDRADTLVVSSFVNPLQYGPNEDPARRPNNPDGDLKLCRKAKVDVLFAPAVDELYPDGFSTFVTEEKLSQGLCGISRPAHFRGFTTVLTKLCNIVRPDLVVFGQKNAQQAAVARKMIDDLNFSMEVIVQPTVRQEDGLACSLRNESLSSGQRDEAIIIHQALQAAKALVESGVRNVDRVVAETTHILGSKRRVRVIYVSVVDAQTMEPARQIVPGRSMLAIAVWVDEHRFIDNVVL